MGSLNFKWRHREYNLAMCMKNIECRAQTNFLDKVENQFCGKLSCFGLINVLINVSIILQSKCNLLVDSISTFQ